MQVLPGPENQLDPYPFFARMRREHPVAWDEERQLWGVFRYDDVRAVLTDDARFSSDFRKGPGSRFATRPGRRNLLNTDPPRHRHLRDLVNQAFTPRAVSRLKPRIEAITRDLLDRVADQREFDLVRDLAYPLPVTVVAELLGVPAADRARFGAWAAQIIRLAEAGVQQEPPSGAGPDA